MSEEVYLLVSNRLRVNAAINALRETVFFGTDETVVKNAIAGLREIEDRLFERMDVRAEELVG
jgi:hypothetical protein